MTRQEAKDIFSGFRQKYRFLPKDFGTEEQLEKITGLYVPFWVANCRVKVDYDAIGVNKRSWREGDYMVTETSEYKIVRQGEVKIEGLPADGSQKIEDELMEAIEPFDYAKAEKFDMAYLSGFYADKYDVTKHEVFPRIRNRAVQGSDSLVRSTMTYGEVHVRKSQFDVMNTTYEYMLLPVWFMTFKYKEKIYEFAINGQTKKLAGTPPLAKERLLAFSITIGLLIFIIFVLAGGFLG